jgi:hypothetical protein
VEGLPSEVECKNVRQCEARIKENDPSIGSLLTPPSSSRHLVPVGAGSVAVIREGKGDAFVRDVLKAAVDALTEANDSFRSGDIVRGLVTVTKTLELYKASFETSRQAYECLILSLRGLGLSLKREYGTAAQPAELALATGMRRYDVACAIRIANLSEQTFTEALNMLRERNIWPSWNAYIGAVKESTDPESYQKIEKTRQAEGIALRTKDVLLGGLPQIKEATRSFKTFTIACIDSAKPRALTRAVGEREAVKIQETFASAAALAHDLECRSNINGSLRAALKSIQKTGKSCNDLIAVKDELGPIFLGDVKETARALLIELNKTQRVLEAIIAS